jgi:hypothetical protein
MKVSERKKKVKKSLKEPFVCVREKMKAVPNFEDVVWSEEFQKWKHLSSYPTYQFEMI